MLARETNKQQNYFWMKLPVLNKSIKDLQIDTNGQDESSGTVAQ